MAKHYAISDIHGMWDIYEQVCAMLQPDDVVYFLGDAGDRGYANFECIKAIYENPQWIYLKGNHEDMFVKGIRELTNEECMMADNDDFDLWMYNGGYDTYEGWLNDGADTSWLGKLNRLPLTAEYTNSKGVTFHMSHAGYTCGRKDQMWGDQLLWSREHFCDHWPDEYSDEYINDICIHGHTPIPYLIEQLEWLRDDIKPWNEKVPEARAYCDGHKICIDNGAFYTGATVLFDLDEMTAIPIFDREFKKPAEEEEDESQ